MIGTQDFEVITCLCVKIKTRIPLKAMSHLGRTMCTWHVRIDNCNSYSYVFLISEHRLMTLYICAKFAKISPRVSGL